MKPHTRQLFALTLFLLSLVANPVSGQVRVTWAAGTTNWDTTSYTWRDNAGNLTNYANGDAVLFEDTLSGASPIFVTNSIGITNGSITFSNVIKSYTLTGPSVVSNNVPITKMGSGTLTIGTTNVNYGSIFFVGEGTVILNSGVSLGGVASGGSMILSNGVTLSIGNTGNGTPGIPVSLTAGANVTNTANALGSGLNGNVTGDVNSVINVNSSFSYGGFLFGFSGTMKVNTGTTRFSRGNNGATDLGSPTANFIVNGNLQPRNQNTIVNLGSLSGTGTLGGSQTTTTANTTVYSVGALNTNTTFGGTIVEANFATNIALVKVGTGTLTLTGNSPYSGPTTIGSGMLLGVTGGSCSNSSFTVVNGATNGVSIATPGGQFTVTNLTYAAAGIKYARFDFGANTPSTTTAPLLVQNTLAINGPLNVLVTGTAIPPGTYPLIKYTAFSGTAPSMTLSLPPGMVGIINNDTVTTKTFYLVVIPVMTVTNNLDSGPGSLRQAIADAPSGNAIIFTNTLSGSTILLTNGQLTLNKNLTIDGSALANGISISGNGTARVFEIASGMTNVLTALTITNGNTAGSGGGIYNQGNLTVNRCTLAGNVAISYGGGIENEGTLTVNQSTITANTNFAGFGGSAIDSGSGTVMVNQSTISGNTAIGGSSSGGIYIFSGSGTLSNSIVAGNIGLASNVVGISTPAANCNLVDVAPQLMPLGNYGGPTPTMPPLPGSPAIDACTNGASFAIDQRGLPRGIDGDGNGSAVSDIGAVEANLSPVVTTVADNGAGSLRQAILNVDAGGTITFTSTLSGSNIVLTSGQLLLTKNVSVNASALTNGIIINGNAASRVFYVTNGVTVVLNALTITNGLASGGFPNGYGGGIYNDGILTLSNSTLTANLAFAGGALYNHGPATIQRSTLYGNSASHGGGIQNEAPLTAINSTFYGNTAIVAGGGINATFGQPVTLNFCTLTANTCSDGGGIRIVGSSTVISNSIVAGNVNSNNVAGVFTGSNNLTNGVLSLAPLGKYGGFTLTMPPLAGSPALDSAGSGTLANDQRGFPRPFGDGPDIGAVEISSLGSTPFGNALGFNSNQYVSVTNFGSIIPTNEVTVEFWAYTTAADGQAAFLLNPDQNTNRFLAHLNYGGPAPDIGVTYWDFGNINTTGRLGPKPAPANSISNWVHYAMVASQSGNYMSIYTNGVLYASKSGMTPFARGNYELRIGGTYRGRLDEFRIWNTARSQGQIQANMNVTLSGFESGLLLYYSFDSLGGIVVTNRAIVTAAAYNGTTVNNPASANASEPFSTGGSSASLAYTFTTFAGLSTSGSSDGVGNDARFNGPAGVAVDTNGNVYVADTLNSTIRKISPAGVVTTIGGLAGNPGLVDGPRESARFNNPSGVAVDNAGNVYVGDYYNRAIRKIATNGVVSTLAFAPQIAGYYFANQYLAVDGGGTNIYSQDGYSIIKLTLVGTNWVKTTLAGNAGIQDYADGTGTSARFMNPAGIALDKAGNVYVSDTAYNPPNPTSYIRKITPAGVVTTIAGGGAGFNDNGDGTNANTRVTYPVGIAVDQFTNIYVGDGSAQIVRKISPQGPNWVVTTIAGQYNLSGLISSSHSGVGTNALFGFLLGVAADSSGNVYVVDTAFNNINKITSAGLVTAMSGPGNTPDFRDGTGSQARFNYPSSVTLDSAGNLYVADRLNHVVRKISPVGQVITLAGQPGVAGEQDGTGNQALFSGPRGVVADQFGNVFVTDSTGHKIRKITPAGVVTTIAGNGLAGYVDATGTSAQFNYPAGIAVDSAGNLFVADEDNDVIRMIAPNGTVSTVAGSPISDSGAFFFEGVYFNSGVPNGGYRDGIGTSALFNHPSGVAVDGAGNIYVTDTGNVVIRKITPVQMPIVPGAANWVVTTLAGIVGVNGSADGIGSQALFGYVFPNQTTPGLNGITVDSAGNLYVTDGSNNTIRKITPAGVVTTLAGLAGPLNFGGTDGAGQNARFRAPYSIAVDGAGVLYVVDELNNTIRRGSFTQFGEANQVSFSPPPMDSSLTVTLLPPEALGQWRFPWELAWHNTGDTVTNLVAGNYTVEFQNRAGLLAVPSSVTLPVTGATIYTNLYYPTLEGVDTNNGGSLTVTLGPNPPAGSGWGFLGASPPWYPSGFTTNLVAGNYLLTFKPVSGRVTPPNLSVQISIGQPTYVSENYLLAQSAPAGVLLPGPVPVGNISDVANYPFGFNGQLVSDTGNGSGVAVAANVVLTAAHVVFNDQTLGYVSQAYWYFRREVGTFDPQPLAARGWYVLSGYASQRTNDLQIYAPDTSTPQSRNLDVAALYFLSPVAGGGYSGYLPSDATPNTWLASSASKMLVGYPVDGSQFGSNIVAGQMYQTQPNTSPLKLSTDPVTDQRVYTATWFLSYPGNSGGPLYVQLNGYYYPAGVYLGTLYNGVTPFASAVRAIDSDVVNLITSANDLGDSGTNNTGGGVITLLAGSVNASHPAYIQVKLGPAGAVTAGAGWRLQGDATYDARTNYTRVITSSNAVIQFQTVSGWNVPTNQSIALIPGQVTVITANYSVLSATADLATGLSGPATVAATNNFTYTLFVTNLGSAAATSVLVTNALPPGVTFVTASGSGVNNAGVVTWPVVASLVNGGTTNYTLTVKAPLSGMLTNTLRIGGTTSDLNPANNTTQLATLVIVTSPIMVMNTVNGVGISGAPGTKYRIEYRSSLTSGQWVPLQTNTIGAGISYVLPWPPTNTPAAFYRAVWLP